MSAPRIRLAGGLVQTRAGGSYDLAQSYGVGRHDIRKLLRCIRDDPRAPFLEALLRVGTAKRFGLHPVPKTPS